MNVAAERTVAFMLAASMQMGAGQGEAAARPAKHKATGDRIVPTVEVLREVRAARQHDLKHGRYRYGHYRFNTLGVYDYPIMTVNVEPAKPDDFVVTINNTHYKPGEHEFRVVPGRASIIVTGRGKEPCEATLVVTEDRPNTVACRL
jgi:hypothetical protein